ncbi:unnamed protein product [Ixodes persulcatus]
METDSLALSSLALTRPSSERFHQNKEACSVTVKSNQRSRFCCATYFCDQQDKHGTKLPYFRKMNPTF